jgi:hypothetical protein
MMDMPKIRLVEEIDALRADLAAVQNESIDHGNEAYLLRADVARLRVALRDMIDLAYGLFRCAGMQMTDPVAMRV